MFEPQKFPHYVTEHIWRNKTRVFVRFVLNSCILNYFTFPLSWNTLFLIRLDPLQGFPITQTSTKILIKKSGLKEFRQFFLSCFGQKKKEKKKKKKEKKEKLKIIIYEDRKWHRHIYLRGPRAVLKTSGTVFPNTDRPRPQNGVFIFFALRYDFGSNLYVKFQLKPFSLSLA